MSQRFGPELRDGSVVLRCWAPGARSVEAVLQPGAGGERRLAMRPGPEGFFTLEVEGGAGLRYCFARDGGRSIPDPASRFQPDGVEGPSQVVDLERSWGDAGWCGVPPRELCVYELHIGTFSEEGTYAGAIRHLDHLADLGVTALEIMPLAAFPGSRGWGYDGTFHFAPHAGYGTPAELQTLVEACHQRGLAVILDLVTNHFGPHGNAMWELAPDFFRPDRPTAWSSGINWEADAVLGYFEEVAAFWTRAYHLDGLRLDAFHAVPRESRAGHLQRMLSGIEPALGPERCFTVLLESVDNQSSLLETGDPRLHLCQLNFDYQRASHALLTGERHGEYQDYHPAEPELERCLGSGFCFLERWSDHHHRTRGEPRPPALWTQVVNYLQNHDTAGNRYLGHRLDHLVPGPALEAATALLLLHPGIPFLFMGQEWSASTPFYFFTDLPENLLAAVRAGRRAGFREIDPDRCPERAPDCSETRALTGSRLRWTELEASPHRERLAWMRELLRARRSFRPLMGDRTSETRVLAEGRLFVVSIAGASQGSGSGERGLLLCANLQERPAPLPPEVPAGPLLYSSRPLAGPTLPPWCTTLFQATT